SAIQFANKHFADIFGYELNELLEWESKDIEKVVHADDRGIFTPATVKKRQASPPDKVSHLAFRAQKADKVNISVDMYSKPVDFEGSPAELIILIDSTEGRHAQDQQMREEIRYREGHKQEAVERLAGTMAHNFNELLTIISGHSELALMSVSKIDPIRLNIEAVHKAAVTGSNLTWQLLTYARKVSFQSKIIDTQASLTTLIETLKRVLGSNVELETKISPDAGSFKTDQEQFERVMLNLTQNAREAMPRGGKVTLEATNAKVDKAHPHFKLGFKEGNYVCISLTDTGKGMSEDMRKRIYDPFFTTKEQGKSAGLGLSVVYGMIKKSGGHFWVDSEIDSGTTFYLYFPVAVDQTEDTPTTVAENEDLYGSGETILVVEDDDRVREMAAAILRQYGYSVLQAGSGKEAQSIAEERAKPVDLILSDVFMPNIGGIEMVQRIKTIWPEVNVMYMSGAAADGSIDGSIPFLKKPFSSTELARTVKELLT
ncbi:ATP-binding protein, partial [Calditrichota bacterium]